MRRATTVALAFAAVLIPVACGRNDGGTKVSGALPPTVSIDTPTTAPTYDAASSPLFLGGTAWDDTLVVEVTWFNAATADGGTANGTVSWSATVPLAPGSNLITVTARDPDGNSASDSITVTLAAGTWAWGVNWTGQLGDGATLASEVPVQVIHPGDPSGYLQNAISMAAGGDHTAAVLGDGTVWAWGLNGAGQLGDGSTALRTTPAQVVDPSDPSGFLQNAIAISAGHGHTVALLGDGTVRAWGANWGGGLGDGTLNDSPIPVQVVDASDPTGFLQNVIDVDAGSGHTMALLGDGTVRAWGSGSAGQLGSGSRGSSPTPVQVVDPSDPSGFLQNVTAISAGSQHSTAVLGDGTVRTWGLNEQGQLGDGTTLGYHHTPLQVVDPSDPSGFLQGAASVAAGEEHTLASMTDGSARSWGGNAYGRLGDGSWVDSPTPVRVVDPSDPSGFLTDVAAVTAGYLSSLALKTSGDVWHWGHAMGGSGGGSQTPIPMPDPSDPSGNLRGVADFDLTFLHAPVARADGTGWVWGSNDYGQIGNGTSSQARPFPVLVVSPTDPSGFLMGAVDVQAGSTFSAALLGDGTVRTWGSSQYGQLGDGVSDWQTVAVQVVDPGDPSGFLNGVIDIDCGDRAIMAVLVDGTVRGWGQNFNGQLADGTQTSTNIPVQALDPQDPTGFLTGIEAISAGGAVPWTIGGGFVLALKSDGTVRAWGRNGGGQLGDGTWDMSFVPVQTIDPADPTGFLTGVIDIQAAASHSAALKGDGSVWTWGWNDFGQLGHGTAAPSTVPLRVIDPSDPTGYLTGVAAIYATGLHTAALLTDGTVRTWGYNGTGQLGDGTTTNSPAPIQVEDPSDPTGFLQGVMAVSLGYQWSLAVLNDGTLRAWGLNGSGQLGDGTLVDSPVPVQVMDPADPTGYFTGATAAAAGAYHAIVVK